MTSLCELQGLFLCVKMEYECIPEGGSGIFGVIC